MFVSCSEISKSVTVKHMQHVGIIRAFCLPAGLAMFFSAWGDRKKNAGLWFARGVSTQDDTMLVAVHI